MGANSHSPGRELQPQTGELFRLIPKASCNRVIREEGERGNSGIRKLSLFVTVTAWTMTRYSFILLLGLKNKEEKQMPARQNTAFAAKMF